MLPINFMLKADEVAYILRHAGARTLATDSGLAELARAAAALDTQVTQFVWLPSEDASEPVAGMHHFDELAAFGERTRLDKELSELSTSRGNANALYLNRTYFGLYHLVGQ
jgi:acyl-CoA synthetase (AMP-forming)/AMP-acid ligase II